MRWLAAAWSGLLTATAAAAQSTLLDLVLVSHLAIAGLEWQVDGTARGATEIDATTFAELDLR